MMPRVYDPSDQEEVEACFDAVMNNPFASAQEIDAAWAELHEFRNQMGNLEAELLGYGPFTGFLVTPSVADDAFTEWSATHPPYLGYDF